MRKASVIKLESFELISCLKYELGLLSLEITKELETTKDMGFREKYNYEIYLLTFLL